MTTYFQTLAHVFAVAKSATTTVATLKIPCTTF